MSRVELQAVSTTSPRRCFDAETETGFGTTAPLLSGRFKWNFVTETSLARL